MFPAKPAVVETCGLSVPTVHVTGADGDGTPSGAGARPLSIRYQENVRIEREKRRRIGHCLRFRDPPLAPRLREDGIRIAHRVKLEPGSARRWGADTSSGVDRRRFGRESVRHVHRLRTLHHTGRRRQSALLHTCRARRLGERVKLRRVHRSATETRLEVRASCRRVWDGAHGQQCWLRRPGRPAALREPRRAALGGCESCW